MTEPLAVGQFAIVDHEPVDRAPCVGVFRGRGPADDRPELYVLAEGTTPAGEQFAAHVISAAGQAWASVDISVTGSLMRLFSEAEKNLAEWNARSIAQHRVSLGLGALVRRGRQVVLAQAGPSLAFHFKAGSVRIYAPEGEHCHPLGGHVEPVTPQLRGLMVEPGDRILLISTAALSLADQDLIGAILGLPPDQVLRDLYQRVREARSVSVLLLTMPEEPGAPQRLLAAEPERDAGPGSEEFIIGLDTPSPPPPAEPFQPSLFIAAGRPTGVRPTTSGRERTTLPDGLPAAEPIALEPLRRVVGADSLPRLTRGNAGRPRSQLGAGSVPLGPANVPAAGRGATTRRGPRDRDSFSRGLVRRDQPARRPAASVDDAPPVDLLARQRRSHARGPGTGDEALAIEAGEALASASPLVRVRDGVDGRWRGNSALSTGRRRAPSRLWPPPLPAAIAVLAVVVIVAIFYLPSQFAESPAERYARLVTDAGVAVAAARDEADPGARRTLLTRAQAMLLEARDVRAEAEVTRLLADVSAALSQLDAVRSPAAIQTVASLEQFGDRPLAVTRLAVGDAEVYLLDPAAGRVVGVARNGSDRRVVFEEDQALGRGRPLAIATLEPPGGLRLVLVIDDRNALWSLDSGGASRRAFATPAGMTVTDITAAGGRLYVLDAPGRAVYQFSYEENAFAGAPQKVLAGTDLAAARYLLVGDSIVTVDSDGTVRRFEGALSFELSQAGIDKRLATAEPPQATSVPGEIALLDPANNRVIVLGADGSFVRQYRHEAFDGITALVVAGPDSFVFSGGELRSVTWE